MLFVFQQIHVYLLRIAICMLQNTKKIEHKGVISRVDDKYIYVSILQASACADCHAKTMCSLSEAKEKIIEIPYVSGSYKIGEEVSVEGTTTMGLKAVLYAFIIPLVLMLGILFVVLQSGGSEVEAILSAILSLIVYYIILYVLRDRMKKEFVFSITKKL